MKLKLLATTSLIVGLVANVASAEASFNRLYSDDDNTGDEGLILYEAANSGAVEFARITAEGIEMSGSLTAYDGTVNINDSLTISGSTSVQSTLGVSGNADFGNGIDVNSGGLNVNGATDLNNGLNVDGATTLDATTIVGTTSVTGTTTINSTGAANTSIGGNSNNTSILSSAVTIGQSYTTSVNLQSGDASTQMNSDSIVSTVYIGESSRTGVVSVAKDGTQYVTDENGKVTETEGDGSAITAAVVVTNNAGNTHGIVVEETKTTISGGINSSSLTLNDLGATFSDPSNGAPIQVHGVADGTADFDATNVRQVYSGLAAVLAATPELRLEPGKTGVGVGLGSYGGFNAVGIGFGHMYDNGAVLTGAVSKAPESEVAYKASLSWTW